MFPLPAAVRHENLPPGLPLPVLATGAAGGAAVSVPSVPVAITVPPAAASPVAVTTVTIAPAAAMTVPAGTPVVVVVVRVLSS